MGISKYVAVAAIAALPSMGAAATITGGLAGLEGVGAGMGEPIMLSTLPADFNSSFDDGDAAGVYEFVFENDFANAVALTVADITILQNGSNRFAGGVTAAFGSDSSSVAEGAGAFLALSETVGVGQQITLSFTFGAVTGTATTGPDIDFIIQATPAPVPLPAGLPLMMGALAGLGYVARRKNKA